MYSKPNLFFCFGTNLTRLIELPRKVLFLTHRSIRMLDITDRSTIMLDNKSHIETPILLRVKNAYYTHQYVAVLS
jgi:hypothetical protein